MTEAILPDLGTQVLIPVCALVGILFALFQYAVVSKVKVSVDKSDSAGKNGASEYLIEEEEGLNDHSVVAKCAEIQSAISEGAESFLFTEYRYVGVFMAAFAVLIFLFLGSVEGFSTSHQTCTYDKTKMCKPALATAVASTISFLLGAFTSVFSGYFGMKIATYANARTTLEARKGVGKAFIVAFRSGAVMGFLLAASGLLVLWVTVNVFKLNYGDDWEGLFEAITGYGLGGWPCLAELVVAFTLKLLMLVLISLEKLNATSPKIQPSLLTTWVTTLGDMGSDLFGSYAESSCAAALVVASISSFGVNHFFTALLYPLLISSVGILVCLLTTLFATDFFEIKVVAQKLNRL